MLKMKLTYPEGATPLDSNTINGLIPNLTLQSELNEFEQSNIQSAIKWASRSRKLKKELVSIEGIKLLHKNMFNQTWKWAGKFRTTNTNIGIPYYQISQEVKKLCDDLEFWEDNQTYAYDEIAVRFHHRLVFIHPFPNGNGRLCRLAADLFLEYRKLPHLKWGDPTDLIVSSEIRKEYLVALREADNHNYDRLLKFARGFC